MEEQRMGHNESDQSIIIPENNTQELVTPPPVFSLKGKGRYGRLNYLKAFNIYILITFLVWFISLVLINYFYGRVAYHDALSEEAADIFLLISILIFLVSAIFCIRAGVLRLHDINTSGYFMFLALVPLVNIALSLMLFIRRGDEEENKYGKPTRPSHVLHIILYLLFILWPFAWFTH